MMNSHFTVMLDQLDLRSKKHVEVSDVFTGWFRNIESQLQVCGESAFGRTDIEYQRLPHVRASLLYIAVKHFQKAVNKKQHDKGDLYDHRYFVESVTLGNLVTNDKDLMRTVRSIESSGVNVYNLEEFLDCYKIQS